MMTLGEVEAGSNAADAAMGASRLAVDTTAHMGFEPQSGLADRALLRDRLIKAAAAGFRADRLTAVVCLGVDHLADAEERHGRARTDGALRVFAERLAANLRSADTVARLERDEFAVVQVGLRHPKDGYRLVRRLLARMAAPITIEGQVVTLSLSAGLALAEAEGGEPESWLQEARRARQKARADGAGAWRCADPEWDAVLLARQRLEQELGRALADGRLELHYQPVVELATRRIVSFEALLRWQHPEHGLLEPDAFLEVAEDSGLMVEIGAWVLARACADAMSWPRATKVAVNLSAAQFQRADPVAAVEAALIASGLEPGRLELEVTESVLAEDGAPAGRALERLHGGGVSLTMDDFGSGRSSLGVLQGFPFHRVKIGQSLMAKVDGEGAPLSVVRAVIGIGRSLGLRVTAEGVESEAQMAFLRDEGCDEAQGCQLARPVPNGEVPDLLDLFPGQGRAGRSPVRQAGDIADRVASA